MKSDMAIVKELLMRIEQRPSSGAANGGGEGRSIVRQVSQRARLQRTGTPPAQRR